MTNCLSFFHVDTFFSKEQFFPCLTGMGWKPKALDFRLFFFFLADMSLRSFPNSAGLACGLQGRANADETQSGKVRRHA